jgi:Common central domain of tyrosinase
LGIRKNAKFLSPAERESYVRACVLMKADIVNPAAPPTQRYSRWDENVAIHWMIQQGIAPGPGGSVSVNFGHGGGGAYSFLSWHRYFLYHVEKQLQGYVPGVMIPYWDWTDPAPLMTDTFLGPDGTVASEVRSGYFARDAPGTGTNPTPAPPWWPAGLTGWRLPAAFGTGSGPLRRGLDAVAGLPSVADLRDALAASTYPTFQNMLESGAGLASGHRMHNALHGWIGGAFGQMSYPSFSPFEPLFYLHHCNIDRLWAMWQLDGHATEYPAAGGKEHHRRNDIMYPWTGGAAGYGTSATIAAAIPMPDFSAVGAQRNVDTLDHRAAFDYTYDTLVVIGIGLDRTGSMNAMTPDPMVVAAPDVTKWEAAKRGVSAFLQDCETVQDSASVYVTAGVKTFRRLAANDFAAVLPAPGYGLVKNGTPFSRAAFDSAVAGMSPGGSTPLADALVDVRNTLVEPPFGHVPPDERRYLAMLTDGLLTDGAPMSSIADHSFAQTVVFAMGFGTGADVDYTTLQGMVDKGVTIPTTQVFHGENAGTIDKFYSDALAHAIGFTGIIDPVLELFAGEHAHVEFTATSADDAFLITVQGMDYDDDNWSFHLHGPGGLMAYGDGAAPMHMQHGHIQFGCVPDVTATRGAGRLSLVVQRDNADDECWIGTWRLMVAYRARLLDAMLMPTVAELLWPVAAGPSRGPRYSRLLLAPSARVPTRNVLGAGAGHRLDVVALNTNRSDQPACNAVVNVYGRSRLQVELAPRVDKRQAGSPFSIDVDVNASQGNALMTQGFARLAAPAVDVAAAVAGVPPRQIPKEARLEGSTALRFEPAKVLASLEKRRRTLGRVRDEELEVDVHDGQVMPLRVSSTAVPGGYHVGVYVEGSYCPLHPHAAPAGHHHGAGHADAEHPHGAGGDHEAETGSSACDPECDLEPFSRLLSATVVLPAARPPRRPARRRPSP